MTANTKISNHVSSQVPFFVRSEHQNFVRFLETYYEYTEQANNVVDMAKSFPTYLDIDQTIDVFAEKFYDYFLKILPNEVIADRTFILKRIKDFYRAKGTEKSIEFLLRILFGEQNIDFYYPKRDVLIASDGKWFIEKTLKVSDVFVDGVFTDEIKSLQNFVGRQITGNTSSATAVVERVDVYYEGGTLVKEVKISQQTKEFESGETVFSLYNENGFIKSITANLFSGLLNTVTLVNAGTGYVVGDAITIESNTGTGGAIIVSSVTTGNVTGITAVKSGAGFQATNPILISGGGGSNASASILSVSANNYFHPNSYNISYTTILALANVTINSANYSVNSSLVTVGSNANTTIANTIQSFVYGNTGPIESVLIINPGENYLTAPDASIVANTRITNLGILGRMRIENGGLNYQLGDSITFTNVLGGYGNGARANVRNVDSSGTITEVQFIESNISGYPIGGMGYDMFFLPTANVVSGTGNGAIVTVVATLGDGEDLRISSPSEIGAIRELRIISRGSGYETPPTLNLQSRGDGTAQATATIITGAYTYPGRYINDDGHISGYNFLQDRDYYQTFSYVVKTSKSLEKYRKPLVDLIHPAGMKLFGEFLYVDDNATNISSISRAESIYSSNTTFIGSYVSVDTTIEMYATVSIVEANTVNISALSNVYVEFLTGNVSNSFNDVYNVVPLTSNSFKITLEEANTQYQNVLSLLVTDIGLGIDFLTDSYVILDSADFTYANGQLLFSSL